MKSGSAAKVLYLAATWVQIGAVKMQQTNPMGKVADLLSELKARIQSDGQTEQISYDKYACWCEETLGQKAGDISTSKKQLETLDVSIKKLEGEVGSHSAEIKQLQKDIAANGGSQSEASSIRNKDAANYESEKVETEQCIGALEAAIKVLNGAGTGGGFLENGKFAQLLSVVAEVRGVVERGDATKRVNDDDLQLVRRFVAHPRDFVGAHTGFLSATQTSNNPFGDYAPRSSRIQGILKGMYDTFTADLERGNAAEADAQKSFEQLMRTKQQELGTMKTTLEQQQLSLATRKNAIAEHTQTRDDTKVQLDADEKLFENLKAGCKGTAHEWTERVRLRTEELSGIGRAIAYLTDPATVAVFVNSSTTFIQVVSHSAHIGRHWNAYAKVAHLAQQFGSYGLAQLAVQLRSGGHFDQVIASIDQMIAVLRWEEREDISHRDRCERAEGKNDNDVEDLGHAISAATAAETVLQGEETKLQTQVGSLADEINATKQQIREALDMRGTAVGEFRQALQDDTVAIAQISQAIQILSRFYKANRIPLALIGKQDPYHSTDPNKPPSTSWSAPYGGRSGETTGVIAILAMIKEDLQKEVKVLQQDNAKSQSQFEQEKSAMEDTLDAQVSVKLAAQKELVSLQKQQEYALSDKMAKSDDLDAENKLKQALANDCSWVATHFQSRRDKRKAEIQGLIDAKGFLGGVDSGM